ncbi:MAG: histone deacetylase [Candidatus Thorarchaeota archaeon]|nr:histone deacetylase [Candidatus Thorarchaeota archaeon]
MGTDLVFHDIFTKHIMSKGHPERPERLTASLDYVTKSGLLSGSKIHLIEPKPAIIEEITPLHDENYLNLIKSKSAAGGGFFTLDTAVNKYTYDAAIMAAGGGILAVDRIIEKKTENAYLLCRPPGHHAEFNRALGFCFINSIAVAAHHLHDKHELQRVLILDYDAHHGNGTQNAFYSTNHVLYVGMHQDGRTLFPGTGFPNEIGTGKGKGYNVNISMYPGAGDKSYRLAFQEVIIPLCISYKPEFILVSAGYDGHFDDPLTSLGLTTSGYAMMNSFLHSLAEEHCDGRIAVFLEGGYNLDTVAKGTRNLLEELSGSPITRFKDTHTESETCTENNKALFDQLKANLKGVHF